MALSVMDHITDMDDIDGIYTDNEQARILTYGFDGGFVAPVEISYDLEWLIRCALMSRKILGLTTEVCLCLI